MGPEALAQAQAAELGGGAGVVVAVLAIFVGGGGILTWTVKTLVKNALEGMKANTDAIRAQGTATTAQTQAIDALRQSIHFDMKLREERDRAMFKALDRLERRVEEARRDNGE